jgi:uncharacterized protein (TIGR00255 family)
MLQSMTGFGKASARISGKKLDVEIRSLNSKQLDLNLRMPYIYHAIEAEIRSMINETLSRGKVDVFINVSSDEAKGKASLNKPLVKQYYTELKALAKELNVKDVDYMPLLMRMPDIFKTEETADKAELSAVTSLVKKAAQMVQEFRGQEGKSLKKDIELHLGKIEKGEKEIDAMDGNRIEKQREKLLTKVTEGLGGRVADLNRFEQEIIYYIEKLDINEEKARLRTHCNYFRQTMNEQNGGRKLGFIVQEIGREINTIGSKANDAGIQKIVVDMKDELEKVKEQLLNIL